MNSRNTKANIIMTDKGLELQNTMKLLTTASLFTTMEIFDSLDDKTLEKISAAATVVMKERAL